MEKKDKTCAERIQEHLKGRLKQYMPDFDDLETCKSIINEYTCKDSEVPEDPEALQDKAMEIFDENICNDVLSIEQVTTYKVLLSWGGPSDQFEFDFDAEKVLVAGRYRFLDWFDGAVTDLDLDDADRLSQIFGIYPE